MKFLEIFVFEDCDLEDTSIAHKPKKILKMFIFHFKIGLIKLPPTSKVMENQNFKCVYGMQLFRVERMIMIHYVT